MPRRIRNPATMSVAIEVRSEDRVRSTSWRCCSGRSSGLASSTITGAKINTTTPSWNEVDSTSPAISRYAMKAPMNRGTISVSAPNSSVSPEATLSTSPVGVRSGSTWPSWAALRLTIFIGPYMPTSQVRTIRVWPAIPAAIADQGDRGQDRDPLAHGGEVAGDDALVDDPADEVRADANPAATPAPR